MLKRAIMLVGMLVCVTGYSHAWTGIGSNFEGIHVWRSSDIAHNATNMFISTGHVMLGHLSITKPGVNSSVVFQQAFSSSANFGLPLFIGSSVPFNGGAVNGIVTSTEANNMGQSMIYLMQRSTFGWAVTTTGEVPARIRIFWDYIEPPRP